jgi:reactive intermediate/imine deaminase
MTTLQTLQVINTTQAPAAIGTYSQAIKVNNMVFLSGQIPLVPQTGEMVSEDFKLQVFQTFDNLKAVCEAAGGHLMDIVKLNIYLVDLNHFALVNQIMAEYFSTPYPARAVLGVASLPKNAQIEMDAIMVLHNKVEF